MTTGRNDNWRHCMGCDYEWRVTLPNGETQDECPICTLIEAHVKAEAALRELVTDAIPSFQAMTVRSPHWAVWVNAWVERAQSALSGRR